MMTSENAGLAFLMTNVCSSCLHTIAISTQHARRTTHTRGSGMWYGSAGAVGVEEEERLHGDGEGVAPASVRVDVHAPQVHPRRTSH
jgi:hypothetical protein